MSREDETFGGILPPDGEDASRTTINLSGPAAIDLRRVAQATGRTMQALVDHWTRRGVAAYDEAVARDKKVSP